MVGIEFERQAGEMSVKAGRAGTMRGLAFEHGLAFDRAHAVEARAARSAGNNSATRTLAMTLSLIFTGPRSSASASHRWRRGRGLHAEHGRE